MFMFSFRGKIYFYDKAICFQRNFKWPYKAGSTVLIHVSFIPKAESTNLHGVWDYEFILLAERNHFAQSSICSPVLPNHALFTLVVYTAAPLAQETADVILTFYTFH